MTLQVAHEVLRRALNNRIVSIGCAYLHEVVFEQVFAVLNVVGVGGAQFAGPPMVAQVDPFQQHLVFRIMYFKLYVAELLRTNPESQGLSTEPGSM